MAKVRKQIDPKWREAGRKAAETRRRNLERLRQKTDDKNKEKTKETSDKTNNDKANGKSYDTKEVETKWHLTSQSSLTLKVDLPARERLSDFCDTPWTEKYRPICLNDCIGEVVGYFKAFVKTGSFPLACILHGEYGEGKTSIVKAAVRDYFVLRGLFRRDATFFDITHASKVTREYNGIFAPALFIDTTVVKSGAFSAEEIIRTRVQNFMQYSVGKWPKFICVKPDIVILGENIPISKLETNDAVVGYGGIQKVIRPFQRAYKGNMVRIKAAGMLPFEVTPEHPVLATYLKLGRYCISNVYSPLNWTKAQDLVPKKWRKNGHYVVIPRLKGDVEMTSLSLKPFARRQQHRIRRDRQYRHSKDFPLNVNTAWLLGLYVAEGSGKRQIQLTLHSREQHILTRVRSISQELRSVAGAQTQVIPNPHANSFAIRIGSDILARAFRMWCGAGAHNKKIPDFIAFHKNINIVQAFLDGYVAGDGCICPETYDNTKTRIAITTTSKVLVQQLQLMYARLGKPSFISVVPANPHVRILDHMSKSSEAYHLYLPNHETRWKIVKVQPNHLLVPIRKIEQNPYEGPVCNVKTTDNTYLVSNAVVHNCFDETDRLGHDCQEVVTSLIEKYPRTRTLWTLNDLDNIMDRIVSRAAGGVFEVKKPEPKLIVPRLRHIAQWEKVRIPEEKIREIAKTAPSVRDAIGLLQQQCVLIKATRGRRR